MQPETWLDIQAAHAPERTALVAAGETLDFSDLRVLARRTAAGLQASGVGPGSRVAASLEPGVDYARLIHALLILGATFCPRDPRDPATPVGYDIEFDEVGQIPEAGEEDLMPVAVSPDAPICEITSSGSTGRPKQISLSGLNVFWSALGSAHALGARPDDRWLVCLPLFHVSGLMPVYRGLIQGTAVSIHRGFSAPRVADELSSGVITGISLVPTALLDLVESHASALRQAHTVLVGGAATPAALIEDAISAEAPIAVTYGMTEASSQVAVLPPSEVSDAIGSVGRPLVTSRVRIDQGEILVGGPTVSKQCLGQDGWYRTGDLGRIDSDGRLWVEGRVDDMLITGGENVFPAEIESVLASHPDVREAVAFGVDDSRWQQELRAVVVPASGIEPDLPALLTWCSEALPPYKVPKQIEVVTEIPLGPTGKPARSELAKRASGNPR